MAYGLEFGRSEVPGRRDVAAELTAAPKPGWQLASVSFNHCPPPIFHDLHPPVQPRFRLHPLRWVVRFLFRPFVPPGPTSPPSPDAVPCSARSDTPRQFRNSFGSLSIIPNLSKSRQTGKFPRWARKPPFFCFGYMSGNLLSDFGPFLNLLD